MMRRRRQLSRETVFSFDSFLDLVTNVVGIIIRLILVAWVGARSYNGAMRFVPSDTPPQHHGSLPPVTDPLQQELERQQAELAHIQQRLLEQLHQLDFTKDQQLRVETQLTVLAEQRHELEQRCRQAEQQAAAQVNRVKEVARSLTELEQRRQRLTNALKALEQQPIRKELRYRTPVSQTVHGEEHHFECRGGKVVYIPLSELLSQIVRSLRDKEELLKTQWQVTDVTEPIGAFRLRYIIERRRDALETALGAGIPDPYGSFGYGLSSWQVEPMTWERGETAEQALTAGSEFQRVIEGLAMQQASVTLWVYPDSFSLYRRLRDHLAHRGFTVAGRPLPAGVPIAGSTRGTHSRGQ